MHGKTREREGERLVEADRYRGHASKSHFPRARYTDWNLIPCPLYHVRYNLIMN